MARKTRGGALVLDKLDRITVKTHHNLKIVHFIIKKLSFYLIFTKKITADRPSTSWKAKKEGFSVNKPAGHQQECQTNRLDINKNVKEDP